MFKKFIALIISIISIFFICPTNVWAEDPSLTITTIDASSPFTFTSSTSNDNTTIDGLTINYDSDNNRFTITIADGKTVIVEQYFSNDSTINCNTNLLINGNGTLIIKKVPNNTPSNDWYSSYAFYAEGIMQIGDNDTSPNVEIKIDYDYSANADSMCYDAIYAHQVKILNSYLKVFVNDIVFYLDGPIDDDALYVDNSKVYVVHCCKNDEEAEGTPFMVLSKRDPESYTDVRIINGSEFYINSNYEKIGIIEPCLFQLYNSGLFVDDSLLDVSFECGDMGFARAYCNTLTTPGTELSGKAIFKNSNILIHCDATNTIQNVYGVAMIEANKELSFIDTIFDIKGYGCILATNSLNITNSSEEYGGIIQNNVESLFNYFLLGHKFFTGHCEMTDGSQDGTPLPPSTINIDYPKNSQILTSKVEGGVSSPSSLTNDTTLNGDTYEYRFIEGTSINDDVQVNYFEITRKYKVSLNLDGGDCDISKILVGKGNTIASLPKPTRAGYKFIKWVDEYDNIIDESTPITSDMTIKAVWDLNEIKPSESSSSSSGSSGYRIVKTGIK